MLLTKVDSPVEVFSNELVEAETGAKAQKIGRCDHYISCMVVRVHSPKLELHLKSKKDRIGASVAKDEP